MANRHATVDQNIFNCAVGKGGGMAQNTREFFKRINLLFKNILTKQVFNNQAPYILSTLMQKIHTSNMQYKKKEHPAFPVSFKPNRKKH